MGLPDKTYGELISAVVVPTKGAAAEANAKSEPIFTLRSIRKWAQERMAPYKVIISTSKCHFRFWWLLSVTSECVGHSYKFLSRIHHMVDDCKLMHAGTSL